MRRPEFETLVRAHLPRGDGARLADEQRLRELGIDSLRLVELLLTLEEESGLEIIPDEQLSVERIGSVGGLWGLLVEAQGRVGSQPPEA